MTEQQGDRFVVVGPDGQPMGVAEMPEHAQLMPGQDRRTSRAASTPATRSVSRPR